MKKNQKILLLILCLILFFGMTGLDQWSKHRIRDIMPMDNFYAWDDIPVWGDWLAFTHAENTGIAFSIPVPLLEFISVFALIFIMFFFYRIIKEDPDRWINYIAFTLILAGATGNFIDRFTRGMVTDFIKVDLGFWPFNPFAIFNVADSCITVGVGLYLLFTVAEESRARRERKREKASDQ